jgi:hypothetical protein
VHFAVVLLLSSAILLNHQDTPSLEKLDVLDNSEGLLGESSVIDQLGR